MKMFILSALLLTTASAFAKDEVIVKPSRPVYCQHEENASTYVHRIQDASLKVVDDKVVVKILWEIGSCKTILSGNGHAAKVLNGLNVYRSNGSNEIDGLEIKTEKVLDGGAVLSTVIFDKQALEDGKRFNLYFSYGLYLAQAKWTMEVLEAKNQEFFLRLSK